MTSTDARTALRDFVAREIPEALRAELSRLTAQFVAAVVREEREKASIRIRVETQRADSMSSLLDNLAKLNDITKRAKATTFGSSL